jgi:hypothetical protein
MSVKLESAVASGKVVVMNAMSGEIALTVGSQTYHIAKGEKLDLTKLVDKPADILRIGGLRDLLQRKNLILV